MKRMKKNLKKKLRRKKMDKLTYNKTMEANVKLCKCGCGQPAGIIRHTIVKKGKFKGGYHDFLPYHHLKYRKKSEIQKDRMSDSRKKWYIDNPEKAKLKAIKCSQTKIKEGTSNLEKNPNWSGGKSFEPYTTDFNNRFKEAIRMRDTFLCLKCGMREEDSLFLFKRKLHIHHIDYIKENTIKENCCTLCQRCNSEVNINRVSWTKFFQSLLSEKYGYKYSENGEIIINLETCKEVKR
jgi:hypothetical protein